MGSRNTVEVVRVSEGLVEGMPEGMPEGSPGRICTAEKNILKKKTLERRRKEKKEEEKTNTRPERRV